MLRLGPLTLRRPMSDFDSSGGDAPEIHGDAARRDDAHSLSPAVRRLIKQYGLDAAAIQGSGPGGRIRVADVMAVLGGRAAAPSETDKEDTGTHYAAETPTGDSLEASLSSVQTARSFARHHPATTVFECDLTNVSAHRKRMSDNGQPPPATAYYAFALLRALADLGDGGAPESAELGVVMPAADGSAKTVLLERPLELSFDALGTRLRDGEPDESADEATWLIHHHGLTGSLVAMPTPLGERQQFSLGVGKTRRIVAIKSVGGAEAPRAVTQCYLSLSFHPDEIDLRQANRLLGRCVETLESWPVDGELAQRGE